MITIYEPFYKEGQILSEPVFTPLHLPDNSHAAWREFKILIDFYRRGDHRKHAKTGIFSPKFGLKTKISGAQFIEFAESHGDADVCIINTFPAIPYCSFNVWGQGEVAHPGVTAAAQELLDVCGINWDLNVVPRHNSNNLCYCNFWVGTPTFWDGYFGDVLLPIAEFLESNPDAPAAKKVMQPTTHTDDAPFLPFIIERLLTTYLSMKPQIKIAAYPLPAIYDYCFTDFEKEQVEYIRPRVDAADANEYFDDDLRSLMNLFCKLYQRYVFAYFAMHPHPHSGKTVIVDQNV